MNQTSRINKNSLQNSTLNIINQSNTKTLKPNEKNVFEQLDKPDTINFQWDC